MQDVSDRIEKETVTSSVVQSLENGAANVVGRDWKAVIGEELRNGKLYALIELYTCINALCFVFSSVHVCQYMYACWLLLSVS